MSQNKAWMNAYTKGSKSLQARLSKIHANNPEFQEFVNKHGFGGNLSVKQSGQQKTHSVASVKPTTDPHPESKVGPQDRMAMIKASAEKIKNRRMANANRVAFGGELGGGFQMPAGSFRRYSESLDESKVVDKILAHPAVEYYGGKDDSHFINLKKGWHMGDGQRSFSNENAGQALKELKRVVKFKKGEAKEYGIDEGAMPSSIIKTKQKFAEKSPEELRAAFKEVAGRTGKSVEDIARSTARRHGHKDLDTYLNRMGEETIATHVGNDGYTHTLDKKGTNYAHIMEPKSGKGKQTIIGGRVVVGQSWGDATGKKLPEEWNKTSAERGIKPGEVDTDTFERDKKILAQRKSRPYQPNRPSFASGMKKAAEQLRKDRARKTDEEINYKDASYTNRRGGWVVKRNGKVTSAVLPTERHAQEFINSTRMTLGRKVADVVRKKAKDIARGMGRYSTAPTNVPESVGANPKDPSSLTVDTPRNKAQALRAAGKYTQAREIERKALAMGFAKEKRQAASVEESAANRRRIRSPDSAILKERPPFTPDKPKKNMGIVVGKNDPGYSLARHLARLGLKKALSMENTEMANKKTLNELRKTTLAAYLAKAPRMQRADDKIAADFDNDVYHDLKTVNRHSVYNMDGKEKNPARAAAAEKSMKVNADLRDRFKRGANNRIKGIARAGRLLAKEGVELTKKGTPRKPATGIQKAYAAGTLGKAMDAEINRVAHKPSLMDKIKSKLRKEDTVNEAGKNPYGPGYKLVDKDGTELKVGHKFKFTSHHEGSKPEHHEITGWQSGAQRGNSSSSGRVAVKVGKGKNAYHTEYFPHVFDMKVVKEEVVNEAGKNPYGPGYKLVDKDGTELKVGHKFKFTSHHEGSKPEHHEITGWRSGACDPLRRGRVAVKVGKGKNAYHTEYFPHVFDMKVVKEEVVNEADKADRKSTMALARHWRDHLTHIGSADYYSHEGERKGRDPKPHEKKAANVEKKVAAKWGKSAAKDMATHNWDVVLKDGMAQSSVRGPIELRKKHNIARHWAGNNEGSLTEGTDEINEVKTSTIVSVATKRYAQAQQALKDKDYGGYVKGMKKAIKAADATTPKSGWSAEDDADTGVFGGPLPHKNLSKGQQAALDKVLPKREEVSPQEKYRQIRENKAKSARMSAKWSKDLERERKGADIYKGKPTKDPYLNDTSLDKKTRG